MTNRILQFLPDAEARAYSRLRRLCRHVAEMIDAVEAASADDAGQYRIEIWRPSDGEIEDGTAAIGVFYSFELLRVPVERVDALPWLVAADLRSMASAAIDTAEALETFAEDHDCPLPEGGDA